LGWLQATHHVAAMSSDARRVKLVAVNGEQLRTVTAQARPTNALATAMSPPYGAFRQLVNAARLVRNEPRTSSATEHLALLKDAWSYRVSATCVGCELLHRCRVCRCVVE
jgi:hypothetical protein